MILIFTARFNEVLLDFDFVLFKLAKRVPLESYPHIRPICLPRPGEDVKGKVVFFTTLAILILMIFKDKALSWLH